MERKLRTKRGRSIFKERGMSVEPLFGQLAIVGWNGSSCVGRRDSTVWSLYSATHNLLKLVKGGWKQDKYSARRDQWVGRWTRIIFCTL